MTTDRIDIDPEIMLGKPVIRGTRITVELLLRNDNLAAGESSERILDQYPSLKSEHIAAAMSYAAELARERVISVPTEPKRG